MSADSFTQSITEWLADLSEYSPSSTPTASPCISRKRARSASIEADSEQPLQAAPLIQQNLTQTAFHQVSGNAMNPTITPSGSAKTSPVKSGSLGSKASYHASKSSSLTDKKRGNALKQGNSSHSVTPSSSGFKLPTNIDTVRASLDAEGIFFEHEAALEQYPDFEECILTTVMGDRSTPMRMESKKAIKQYQVSKKTENEETYFGGLVPLIIKANRGGGNPTEKRDHAGEIMLERAKSFFGDDGLDQKVNHEFIRNCLPLKGDTQNRIGLSTPKPDITYGLARAQFRDPSIARPSAEVEALVGVCPGIEHPFLVVENKGCEGSIEAAENQALRGGVAMVSAQRGLAKMAGHIQPNEPTGPDRTNIAFSCSWVPQMANIHVHWHEKLASGHSVWHMNKVRAYLMLDGAHVSDFRKDIHNILDFGVSYTRKERLAKMVRDAIAMEMAPEKDGGSEQS
ncbi:MAG: hypothetical protein Q9167_007197 [Letrouitia subvulpina]